MNEYVLKLKLTFVALPLLLPLLSLPLNDGGGLSSFDFRFSARRAIHMKQAFISN